MNKKEWISGALLGVLTGAVLHRYKDKPQALADGYRSKRAKLYTEGQKQYDIVQSSKLRMAASAEKHAVERGNRNETKEQ
ncbi:hypothetical protein LCM20_12000 [Halobacillus litoralis]|uniref:hypothetical protein n=1 Tax=Halobacillus litoralis TaxID=45668 RepID=UPI001CD2E2F1|nr:hypothetical protein [Halobacillus litoralis]MCA0971320.1 hypothetical protein [Halobacillus litoralis]